MRVRAVKSFAAFGPAGFINVAEGDELELETLPGATDWLASGLVVPVRGKAERAVTPPGERAVEDETPKKRRPSGGTGAGDAA